MALESGFSYYSRNPVGVGTPSIYRSLCVYDAWVCVGTQCACKHLVYMYSSHVCHQLVLLAPMCVLLAQVKRRSS